jgi:hypothetical protein
MFVSMKKQNGCLRMRQMWHIEEEHTCIHYIHTLSMPLELGFLFVFCFTVWIGCPTNFAFQHHFF